MLEPVLFGSKILFLLLLYLFIFMIVRSVSRDLSRGREVDAAPVAAAPQPPARAAKAPSPRPKPPALGQPAPAAGGGTTGEFDSLVTDIRPRLVVQHSTIVDDGRTYDLEGGATIGRSPGSDIVLPDDFVSQTHARIFARKQFLYIEDLGSTNGTFVDGRRIEGDRQIKPGQEVVIGDTIFRYEE